MTDQLLRLAVGSHKAGSGKGCAMNIVSWENGDIEITDRPDCSDPMLSSVVRSVNDVICDHRDGDLLCASCSVKVLGLAHRTVGTAGLLSETETRRVHVLVACAVAREVAYLNDDPRVAFAIDAAETWAHNPTANAAATYARAAATYARRAATYATYDRAAAYAAYAAANAVNAAASASRAAASAANAASSERLRIAHLAIDIFKDLTGHTDQIPEPATVTHAYHRMLETS